MNKDISVCIYTYIHTYGNYKHLYIFIAFYNVIYLYIIKIYVYIFYIHKKQFRPECIVCCPFVLNFLKSSSAHWKDTKKKIQQWLLIRRGMNDFSLISFSLRCL